MAVIKNYVVYQVQAGQVSYLKNSEPGHHEYTDDKRSAKKFTKKQAHKLYRDIANNAPHSCFGFGPVSW